MEAISENMGLTHPATDTERPVFLHVSILRLITMSIFSCGMYELYWIYKNWSYLKIRDRRFIRPFWRAWFGIFYCHSLLETMHSDKELTSDGVPKFAPRLLATLWVILTIAAYAMGRDESMTASFVAILMPSYLCFVPVQQHVNRVNRQINPGMNYTKWTKGHIACLIYGLLIWGCILFLLLPE